MANERALQGAAQGAAAGSAGGPWGAAIGGGIGLIGGMMGDKAASEAEDKAKAQMTALQAMIAGVPLSAKEDLEYQLQAAQLAGKLTPEQEIVQKLEGRNPYEQISTDPRLRQSQMQSLELLKKLGTAGITPEESAQLASIQRSTEADEQARLKSMLEQQQARGMASSDAALTARMIDSQSAANRQAMEAQNTAAMGFQRALQAMSGAGSLAGQMENSEYSQAANLANAQQQDRMNEMLQRAAVQQRNVAGGNAAQQFNLQNMQEHLNQQANVANEMARQKANASQIMYNQRMGKATGQVPIASNLANMDVATGARKAQQYTDMGTGLGKAAYGAYNAYTSQPSSPTVDNSTVNALEDWSSTKKPATTNKYDNMNEG